MEAKSFRRIGEKFPGWERVSEAARSARPNRLFTGGGRPSSINRLPTSASREARPPHGDIPGRPADSPGVPQRETGSSRGKESSDGTVSGKENHPERVRENEAVDVRLHTLERVPNELRDVLTEAARRSWEASRKADTAGRLPSEVTLNFVLLDRANPTVGDEVPAYYDNSTRTTYMGLNKILAGLGVSELEPSEHAKVVFADMGAHETRHRAQDELGMQLRSTAAMSEAEHGADELEIDANSFGHRIADEMWMEWHGKK